MPLPAGFVQTPGPGPAAGAAEQVRRLMHVLDWAALERPLQRRMRQGLPVPDDAHRQLQRHVVRQLLGEPALPPVADADAQPALAAAFGRFMQAEGLAPVLHTELQRQWRRWRAVVLDEPEVWRRWVGAAEPAGRAAAVLADHERARALDAAQAADAGRSARGTRAADTPGPLARQARRWRQSLLDQLLSGAMRLATHGLAHWRGLRHERPALAGQAERLVRRSGLHRQLADLAHRSAQRLAMACLRDLLRRPSAGPAPDLTPVALALRLAGRVHLRVGQYDLAWSCLSAAAAWGQADPLHAADRQLPWLAGNAAHLSGRYAEAEAAYRCAIALDGPQPQALCNLAHVLLAQTGDPKATGAAQALDEAAELLARAGAQHSGVLMPHQNLAAGMDASGYRPQPLDLLFSRDALLHDASHLVGERLVHLGRGDEGLPHYARALRCQARLAQRWSLPAELRAVLAAEYGVDASAPLRLLPVEWVTLIGHIAMIDSHRKLQLLGLGAPGQPVLLAPPARVANAAYMDLWRGQVRIVQSQPLIDALLPWQRVCGDQFNGWLRPDGSAGDWTELAAIGQRRWDEAGHGPLIGLPAHLDEAGRVALRKMGLGEHDWFVALHVRGDGFHREGRHAIQSHRNADVSDYLGALRAITAAGGWVIRMGDASMPPLPAMPRVIDYPHTEFKSAECDVFLAARARFFIGTTSGLTNAVISLGTPCLLVNCISNYCQLWNERVLFVPRRVHEPARGRHLPLHELAAPHMRWRLFNIHRLRAQGLVPQANSADDITAATLEMLRRMDDGPRLRPGAADGLLQAALARAGEPHFFGHGRLSESFAERHAAELWGQ